MTTNNQTSSLPSVTIVIPAYNEEYALPQCLAAIRKQDYKGALDIIVVDNASTDATSSIAHTAGCTVIHESRKGYNYAVKCGFDAASGEIIACTDADTLVRPDWISRIVATMTEKKAIACGGVFTFHDGPLHLRIIGSLFGRLNYHIAGANMAIRRDAYWQCGGISLTVNLGADVDIGQRLKKIGKVVIDRSIVVATSSRRFACAFWQTLFIYYVNDFCLLLLHRPVFRSFTDFRTLVPSVASRQWVLSSIMAVAMVLFIGWVLQLPSNQMLGAVHAKGPNIRAVALTFDDGPGLTTDTILDILAANEVHATFFVIGKNAEKNPAIIKRISDGGHEIGNHTFSHKLKIALESPSALQKELDSTNSIIERVTGKKTMLFRPPRGWRNPWMIKYCNSHGYETVLWTIDSQDWQRVPVKHVLHSVESQMHPGDIVLMHDRLNTGTDRRQSVTVAALPGIIHQLKDEGYTFVTVSELLSTNDNKFVAAGTSVALQP